MPRALPLALLCTAVALAGCHSVRVGELLDRALPGAGSPSRPGAPLVPQIGEHLAFSIALWGVPAGWIELRVEQQGGAAQLAASGGSNAFLDLIAPFRGSGTTALDAGGSPRAFDLRVETGGHTERRLLSLHPSARLWLWRDGEPQVKGHPLPAREPLDPLGLVWRLRSLPADGSTAQYEVHVAARPECHRARCVGRRRVTFGAEVLEALVVQVDVHPIRGLVPEPSLEPARCSYTLYLSDDPRRLPLRLDAELALGCLSVQLTSSERPAESAGQ